MNKEEIILTLPMPPSINVAYANGNRGRYKAKVAKEWEEKAEGYKKINYFYTPEKGKYLVASYKFFSNWLTKNKETRTKDLSNFFKIMEDKFPFFIEGFDDKYIWKYENIEKIESDREEVEIIIKEL